MNILIIYLIIVTIDFLSSCLRSAYFQQIEEDVQEHSKSILEIKAAINSFQTKDMSELVKFHKHVEQHLEKLSDETQVNTWSQF